jgi:hypothetical protein
MPNAPIAPRPEDATGAARLEAGATIGLAAALATLVLPSIFLALAVFAPGGFFTFGGTFLNVLALLLLAGAILFLLSLLVYRLAFATLRRVDPRFSVASVLCLIGSLGFLLLIISVALLFGGTGSLLSCLHGRPTQALGCLRNGEPLGAYTGLAGFWLGWLGGLGIVVGLGSAGARFRRGAIAVGAALYALLLLVLVGPFLAEVYTIPGQQYLLVLLPVLAVLAPALVLAGTRAPLTTIRPA